MGEPNIDLLKSDVQKLYTLLDSSNRALDFPRSNLSENYANGVSRQAGRIGAMMSRSFSSGKVEEVVIMGVILSVGWLAAAGYDAAVNTINKAKNTPSKALLC